jgi:hypothetical protein
MAVARWIMAMVRGTRSPCSRASASASSATCANPRASLWLENGSQVVQVLFEPSEPQQLVGTQEVRLGRLGKRQVVACVRPAGCFEFALLVQLFQPELANGLQHDEARFFPLVRRLLQQALIEEGRDPLKYTEGLVAVLLAYHFGGLERTAAHEDGEPAEEALLLLAQQGIRPLEGVAQGLLAGGQIACATCQHGEPML